MSKTKLKKKKVVEKNTPWRMIHYRSEALVPYFLVQVWRGGEILGQTRVHLYEEKKAGWFDTHQVPRSAVDIQRDVDSVERKLRGDAPFNRWEWLARELSTNANKLHASPFSSTTDDSLRKMEEQGSPRV